MNPKIVEPPNRYTCFVCYYLCLKCCPHTNIHHIMLQFFLQKFVCFVFLILVNKSKARESYSIYFLIFSLADRTQEKLQKYASPGYFGFILTLLAFCNCLQQISLNNRKRERQKLQHFNFVFAFSFTGEIEVSGEGNCQVGESSGALRDYFSGNFLFSCFFFFFSFCHKPLSDLKMKLYMKTIHVSQANI